MSALSKLNLNNTEYDLKDANLTESVTDLQDNVRMEVFGVIRKINGSWSLIPNHDYKGIDSITVDEYGYIQVNFTEGLGHVCTFCATPDESYSQEGISCGASVTPQHAKIALVRANPIITGAFTINGTTGVCTPMTGKYSRQIDTVTYDAVNNFIRVTFASPWSSANIVSSVATVIGITQPYTGTFATRQGSTGYIDIKPQSTLDPGDNNISFIATANPILNAGTVPDGTYENIWLYGKFSKPTQSND